MWAIQKFGVYSNFVEVRRFKRGPDQICFDICSANKCRLVSLILRWQFLLLASGCNYRSYHCLAFPCAIPICVGHSIEQFLKEKYNPLTDFANNYEVLDNLEQRLTGYKTSWALFQWTATNSSSKAASCKKNSETSSRGRKKEHDRFAMKNSHLVR